MAKENEAVQSAAERGQKAHAELFREFGNDIQHWAKKSFSTTRDTALIRSAQCGRDDLVEILLPHSDVGAVNIFKNTALMAAAQAGSISCVRRLLPLSDVAAKDIIGDTALSLAAANGHPECMAELLPFYNESSVNKLNKMGHSLLMQAAHGRNPKCVEMALAAGGDPKAQNKMGHTALLGVVNWYRQGRHFDAHDGNIACLTLLLDAGADPLAQDKRGRSALMEAACHLNSECAKMLLARSDVEARDENGNTALIFSARKGGLETLGALLALCDPLASNNKKQTPLGIAVLSERFEHALMIFDKLRSDPRAEAGEKALARISAKTKAFELAADAQTNQEELAAAKRLHQAMAAWAEGLKIGRGVGPASPPLPPSTNDRRKPRL